MGAYRKLLVRNEITSEKGNCLNDITQLLEVSSNNRERNDNRIGANSAELELLANYDFEHRTEGEELEDEEFGLTLSSDDNDQLSLHSMAYTAALVEKKVIQEIVHKGTKACSMCIEVFNENELLKDDFLEFISSKDKKIITPCKSTFDIIKFVEKSLSKYSSQAVSFQSMTAHILNAMHNWSHLYKSSIFDESHDHHAELIKYVIDAYLNIKSKNASKILTRLAQKKLLRHQLLKQVHREGQ